MYINSRRKMDKEEQQKNNQHCCYQQQKSVNDWAFFSSCPLLMDMVWNFCLTVQRHVLCHDSSYLWVHVWLQKKTRRKKEKNINWICINCNTSITMTCIRVSRWHVAKTSPDTQELQRDFYYRDNTAIPNVHITDRCLEWARKQGKT